MFGQPAAAQPAAGGGLFGQPAAQPAAGGGGLFGQQTPPRSSFAATGGGGLFGAQNTQASGAFGAATTPPQSGGGLFGASTTPQQGGAFGQTPQQGGGMFGAAGGAAAGGVVGTVHKFQAVKDTESALMFDHIGAMPCYQGKSFDELRWDDYQANRKLPGDQGTAPAGGGGMFGQQNTQPQAGAFGQPAAAAGGGLFGQPAAQPAAGGGLFGQAAAQPAAGGGLFGSTPAAQPAAGGGLFGQPAAAQPAAGGGLFGQPAAANTGGGLFGGGAATQSGAFGLPAAQPAAGGGLFGAAAAQPVAGGGLFGQPAAAQPAAGGGLFGQPAQSSGGGLFGSTPAAQPAAGGGLFGGAGAAQPAAGGGLFGGGAAASSGGGLFGAASPAPAAGGGGLFGSASPAPAAGGGLFGGGAAAANTGGGLFGGGATATAGGGGLFGGGAAANTGGGLFGGGAAASSGGGLFGGAGAQPAAGGGLFGGAGAAQPAAGGGLFGGAGASTGGGLFGGAGAAAGGGGGLFGGAGAASAGGGLFGGAGAQPAAGGGLFGGAGAGTAVNPVAQQAGVIPGADPYGSLLLQQLVTAPTAPPRPAGILLPRQQKAFSTNYLWKNHPDTVNKIKPAPIPIQNVQAAVQQQALAIADSRSPRTSRIDPSFAIGNNAYANVSSPPPHGSMTHRNTVFLGPLSPADPSSYRHLTIAPGQIPISPRKSKSPELSVAFSPRGRGSMRSPRQGGSSPRFVSDMPLDDSVLPLRRPPDVGGGKGDLGDPFASYASPQGPKQTLNIPGGNSPSKRIGSPFASSGARRRPDEFKSPQYGQALVPVMIRHELNLDGVNEAVAHSLVPILTRPDYYCKPSIDKMCRMSEKELSEIDHLQIGRYGNGFIEWPGLTDVRGLDFDNIVKIEPGQISVYVEDENKPEQGQGLNKSAVINLNLKPTKPIKTEKTKMRYIERLKERTENSGSKFISYDLEKWVFMVEHFSSYGVTKNWDADLFDGDDDDDEEEVDMGPEMFNQKYGAYGQRALNVEAEQADKALNRAGMPLFGGGGDENARPNFGQPRSRAELPQNVPQPAWVGHAKFQPWDQASRDREKERIAKEKEKERKSSIFGQLNNDLLAPRDIFGAKEGQKQVGFSDDVNPARSAQEPMDDGGMEDESELQMDDDSIPDMESDRNQPLSVVPEEPSVADPEEGPGFLTKAPLPRSDLMSQWIQKPGADTAASALAMDTNNAPAPDVMLAFASRACISASGEIFMPWVSHSTGTFHIKRVKLLPHLGEKDKKAAKKEQSELLKCHAEHAKLSWQKKDENGTAIPEVLWPAEHTAAIILVESLVDSLNRKSPVSQYAKETFRLVNAAFGDSDGLLQYSKGNLNYATMSEPMKRRAVLCISDWLRSVNTTSLRPKFRALQEEARVTGALTDHEMSANLLESAFLNLCCNNVPGAVRDVMKSPLPYEHLALTMAAAGGKTGRLSRAAMARQVAAWEKIQAEELMPAECWRLWSVIGGSLDSPAMALNDWRAAFGLFLWYRARDEGEVCPFESNIDNDLANAIRSYWAAVEGVGPDLPPPVPAYVSDPCLRGKNADSLDMQFALLGAAAGCMDLRVNILNFSFKLFSLQFFFTFLS